MTDAPFKMSQGYDVLPPKSGEAYPIPCEEWDFLKKKIRELSDRPWLLNMIGSILLGAGLSTLITIVVGAIATDKQKNAVVVAWAAVAVTVICGAVCLFLADRQKQMQTSLATDVVIQMELIEKRFDRRTS